MNSRQRVVTPNTQKYQKPQYHDSVTIRSRTDECGKINQRIVEIAALCGFTRQEQFHIQLAVEEALVNAVKHGNREDASANVVIDYRVTPVGLHVRITDEGDGFDPDSLPDPTDPRSLEMPGGRGVFLMRQFMTSVQFNEKGNSVELWKLIQ